MDQATLRVWTELPGAIIQPTVYGHFIEHLGRCTYDGLWVGDNPDIPNTDGVRDDLVKALKPLAIPVLRWPGGCFADQYHWRDGIGPRASRPAGMNMWWQQLESNAFGTEEFLRLCRDLACEPYLSVNVGSGSVREAREWVEYCNFDQDTDMTRLRKAQGIDRPHGVTYWGVGNETWGCGGSWTAEAYAVEYARYAAYLKGVDPNIQLVAAGGSHQWKANTILCEWNHKFCQAMPHARLIDHLSIHHYFIRGNDTTFTDSEYYGLFADLFVLEHAIQQVDRLLGYFYPDKHVGLAVDEWGTWHPQAVVENGLEQTNTLRDGLFAAATLNLLNRYAHRVTMANLAQMINVLQCLVHTDGHRMLLSPVYHAFDMMKGHMGGRLLAHRLDGPTFECRPKETGKKIDRPVLDVSASQKNGAVTVTIVNQSLSDDVELRLLLDHPPSGVEARMMGSADPRECNSYQAPNAVAAKPVEVGIVNGELTYRCPATSVTVLTIAV